MTVSSRSRRCCWAWWPRGGAEPTTVLTAGVAATTAGAASIGVAEYVSVSAQRDTQRTAIDQESTELQETPHLEREEMSELLQDFGISVETADKAAREI